MGSLLKHCCHRILVVLALGILLCLATHRASAQELSETERKAAARELLDQARKAQEVGEHEKAIGFLTKADSVYRHPAHAYYLGISYAAKGQLLYATEAYRRFVRAEPTSEQMRQLQQEAKLEIDKLEPKIPKLTIQVRNDALSQVTILLDGKAVPAGALNVPIPVNPGEYTVSIQSDTYELVGGALTLELGEGATELVELDLKAVITQVGKPSEPAPVEDQATGKKSNELFIGGAAVTGAGVVSLAVGTVLLASAGGKKSDQDQLVDECVTLDATYCTSTQTAELESLANKEEQLRTGAAITYTAGGVAVAAGVTMMLLGKKGRTKERTGRFVQPFVGVQSAGVLGRF
jgi:hypothetical protein